MSGERNAPLSAAEMMTTIRAHLTRFVETEQKGYLSIARDPFDVIELLGEAPGRFRVILNWAGEKTIGDKDSGIVEHSFQVIATHNRGLSIIRGENFFIARGDDPPLTTLNERVRDLLRALRFPKDITSVTLEYAGTEPIAVDGSQIDALTQTWKLIAALPKKTAI